MKINPVVELKWMNKISYQISFTNFLLFFIGIELAVIAGKMH